MSSALNLPLAKSAIDRDQLARTKPELFAELWANSQTRLLPMFDGKVLLHQFGSVAEPALRLFEVHQIAGYRVRVYLGITTAPSLYEPTGTAVVLVTLDAEQAKAIEADESQWHNLRRTGAGLSERDAGLYAQGLAIANWHETHQHCTLCGAKTEVIDGGWVRHCKVDSKDSYPRTDPAIIAAVIDDHDRILLGSQGIWEENRWSVLAGFVEPGESLPAAVQREIFEEAGIRVDDVEYLGSQAWPFPYSLMAGFRARARGEQTLTPDGLEIEKLRWFSREELGQQAAQILLPGRLSIARALIEHWYGGDLISATELKLPR